MEFCRDEEMKTCMKTMKKSLAVAVNILHLPVEVKSGLRHQDIPAVHLAMLVRWFLSDHQVARGRHRKLDLAECAVQDRKLR